MSKSRVAERSAAYALQTAVEPAFGASFDLLATAPQGVAKLRELILSLAVRGKLVPQDGHDEPAAATLAQLRIEKERLIETGKIRRERAADVAEADEVDFALPHGWAVAQLSALAWPQAGFAFKSSAFNDIGDGLPLIRIRDVGVSDPTTFFSGEYRDEFVVRSGDWLVGMDGDFRVALWRGPDSLLNQRVTRLVFFGSAIQPLYICLALQQELRKLQGVKAYTTVDHLSGQQIASRVIPLPPLAEQARIVARVEELMQLCDTLEAHGRLQDEQHARLVATLFDALAASESAEELAENWQRIATHFDLLLDRPEAVDALEQTLLQLAVRGLLVPQDPNDPSVPIKGATITKRGLVSPGKDETPFAIPKAWQWARLGWVAEFINGDRGKNYPNKAEYVPEGLPFINTGHIEPDGTLSNQSMNYLTREKFESLRSGKTRVGDLVYCLRGATLGKTAIVGYTEGAIASSLVIIRLSDAVFRKYAYYYLISPLGKALIRRFDNGSAQPNLAATSVQRYVFPLPPLAEQHRIVARVEQLRRLCADLRERLQQARATQSRLADALVSAAAQSPSC